MVLFTEISLFFHWRYSLRGRQQFFRLKFIDGWVLHAECQAITETDADKLTPAPDCRQAIRLYYWNHHQLTQEQAWPPWQNAVFSFFIQGLLFTRSNHWIKQWLAAKTYISVSILQEILHIDNQYHNSGLSLDILKIESWMHMGRTANIIFKDISFIYLRPSAKTCVFCRWDGVILSVAIIIISS